MRATLDGMRAQATEGFHAWFVGVPTDGLQRFTAEFRTTARFEAVECLHGAGAGHYATSEDGTTLRFEADLRSVDNAADEAPRRLVAHDHLRFRVEPSDGRVTLLSATRRGRRMPTRTGQGNAPVTLPVTFGVDSPTLAVGNLSLLLPATEQVSIRAPAALYLGVVRPAEREIDDATRERLEALGYVEE
jgi:hypothetical protein